MMLFPIFLALAAIASAWIALAGFERMKPRQRWLLWAILTGCFFGFMMLLKAMWGNGAAWDIFAFVFIGLGAWQGQAILQKTFFKEKKIWEGHAFQNPESEEFSDTLKITTNNLTGARNGLVFSGLFDERYLADLDERDLAVLGEDLSHRDPQGAALLAGYIAWRKGASV